MDQNNNRPVTTGGIDRPSPSELEAMRARQGSMPVVVNGSINIFGGNNTFYFNHSPGSSPARQAWSACWAYEAISTVVAQTISDNIAVDVHDQATVVVDGTAPSPPVAKNGILHLNQFGGTLRLPRGGLRVGLGTTSGNISGYLTSPALVRTISGDVALYVSGLNVSTSTVSGRIDVRGMMAAGRGFFTPPSGRAAADIAVQTVSGDILIEYH